MNCGVLRMLTSVMFIMLRPITVAAVALATAAAHGTGLVQFYFSDHGGDNSRLSYDQVTSSMWYQEYDIIAKNVGDEALDFWAGSVLVGYATSNGPSYQSILLSSMKIVVLDDFDTSNVAGNVNIPHRAAWFVGGLEPIYRGGANPPSGIYRPAGISIPIDMVTSATESIAVGEEKYICSIVLKDRGLYGSEAPFHDVFIYSTPTATNSGTSILYSRDGQLYNGVNWEDGSRLRLVPEPVGMIVFAAGILPWLARRCRR